MSPVVAKSHGLIFFTVPKVGCTVFKKLVWRMASLDDWMAKDYDPLHDPRTNGLTYRNQYPKKALKMLRSKEWTKAIFVREPKARFLSAYLDKVASKGGSYVVRHCCPRKRDCAPDTMLDFLHLTKRCWDPHWAPQSKRLTAGLWAAMDFVGSFENVRDDAEALLLPLQAQAR